MTPQQIAAIVLRVCSIFLLFLALVTIEQGRELAKLTTEASYYTQIIFLFYISLACLCWFIPMALANWLIPNTKFKNMVNLQPYQAVFVVCVALGLWIVCSKALPEIIRYFVVISIVLEHGEPVTKTPAYENMRFLISAIQFLLGLFLIFKASFISNKIININHKKTLTHHSSGTPNGAP